MSDNGNDNTIGTLYIFSAPSGAGKTTLVRTICERMENLVVSISYTTRPIRPNEAEGVSYFYIDEEKFSKMVANDEFLEYATVFDYHYGTSKKWVQKQLNQGHDIILEIDWQGAQSIRKIMENISIFILPPTFDTLEKRLRSRANDDESTIKKRTQKALAELSHFNEFDYLIKNDDLETAVAEIMNIIESVRSNRPCKLTDMHDFANELMTKGSDFQ